MQKQKMSRELEFKARAVQVYGVRMLKKGIWIGVLIVQPIVLGLVYLIVKIYKAVGSMI